MNLDQARHALDQARDQARQARDQAIIANMHAEEATIEEMRTAQVAMQKGFMCIQQALETARQTTLCGALRHWRKVTQPTGTPEREAERHMLLETVHQIAAEHKNTVKLYMLLSRKADDARVKYHAAHHAAEQTTQQCNEIQEMILETSRNDRGELPNQLVELRAFQSSLRTEERDAYFKHDTAYTAAEQVAEQLKKLYEQHSDAQEQLRELRE